MSKYEMESTYVWRLFTIAVLLGVGYLIGVTSRDATVQAGVRPDQTEQQPFQTGDQRSEVVLREISAQLGKMDQRLDRMEKLATQFVSRIGGQASGETRQR